MAKNEEKPGSIKTHFYTSTRNPVLGICSITTTATPDEYEFKIIEGSRELFHYKHAGITTKTTYIQPPQYSVHLMAKR